MYEQKDLIRIGQAVGYGLEEGDIISVGAYFDAVKSVNGWWITTKVGLRRKIHSRRQEFQVYKVADK